MTNHLNRKPKIITHPELVSSFRTGLMAFVGAVGWLIWVYLLSPLVTFFAWVFGYQRFDVYLLGDSSNTLQTLQLYGLVVLAGGILFISWAVYNWMRFRHVDRRKSSPAITTTELAKDFNIAFEAVDLLQHSKVMTLTYDDRGQLAGVSSETIVTSAPVSSGNFPAS